MYYKILILFYFFFSLYITKKNINNIFSGIDLF